uniref:Tetratricopeptide repeat domain protein n=1 Tax=uncultured prokaryote TaxID=198431 RepID=H5SKC4_9ZZZZ|nr:tetratricopeptide repeat domain protein [uncultured prokaryote]
MKREWLACFYHLRGMTWRYWGHWHHDPLAYRRAERDFSRAVDLLPTFVQALYDRGLLRWRELGDGAGAEADLTRVLELEPGRTEAWFNRAMAREVIGDLSGAVADFRRYLSEGDDPQWREISQRQIAVLEAWSVQEEK